MSVVFILCVRFAGKGRVCEKAGAEDLMQLRRGGGYEVRGSEGW